MTVTYNDSRFTYDAANMTYNGTLLVAVSGSEPAPSGSVARLKASFYALAGLQTQTDPSITYDNPGYSYNDFRLLYDGITGGILTWIGVYHRSVAGDQPPASGSLLWLWNPYVWSIYEMTISDRPSQDLYMSSVETDDTDVLYVVDIGTEHADQHQEIVYRSQPPKPYTRSG